MRYEKENFAFKTVKIEDNDEFIDCNMAQLRPFTEIGKGKNGLVFERCNLLNCKVPIGSAVRYCLTVHKSFCKHLHPDLTNLPDEIDDCEHVIDSNIVQIDGVTIVTEYIRDDLIVVEG